jgi:hypothetical protein
VFGLGLRPVQENFTTPLKAWYFDPKGLKLEVLWEHVGSLWFEKYSQRWSKRRHRHSLANMRAKGDVPIFTENPMKSNHGWVVPLIIIPSELTIL